LRQIAFQIEHRLSAHPLSSVRLRSPEARVSRTSRLAPSLVYRLVVSAPFAHFHGRGVRRGFAVWFVIQNLGGLVDWPKGFLNSKVYTWFFGVIARRHVALLSTSLRNLANFFPGLMWLTSQRKRGRVFLQSNLRWFAFNFRPVSCLLFDPTAFSVWISSCEPAFSGGRTEKWEDRCKSKGFGGLLVAGVSLMYHFRGVG